MAEQPSIDPRYDPAFQRGYDGAVVSGSRADAASRTVGTPRVTSALSRPAAAPPRATRTPDAAGTTGTADAAERIGLPPESASAADATAASEPTVVHVAAPAMRPPWTNPFAIVVALLGIASLGVGLYLVQESLRLVQSNDGFETQLDYWSLQWGLWGGAIFTGVGVLVIAGVLMFCAVYWSRRSHLED
ncbi:hypothetical protein H4J02_01465 [Protaetiibacter sp. SSC-01]|uniref:hypothetical protein n=1 Tax=Protaetiibacter sp. SSC-01 TaxID=2759943 RepID=UPI0016569104|nr:hypothetical protein [Protaetiibacter sp. SSC-01]QNO37740.1 hypothetical protein H4J02_01465 [Protaetiibacter sp. SSC-01]